MVGNISWYLISNTGMIPRLIQKASLVQKNEHSILLIYKTLLNGLSWPYFLSDPRLSPFLCLTNKELERLELSPLLTSSLLHYHLGQSFKHWLCGSIDGSSDRANWFFEPGFRSQKAVTYFSTGREEANLRSFGFRSALDHSTTSTARAWHSLTEVPRLLAH